MVDEQKRVIVIGSHIPGGGKTQVMNKILEKSGMLVEYIEPQPQCTKIETRIPQPQGTLILDEVHWFSPQHTALRTKYRILYAQASRRKKLHLKALEAQNMTFEQLIKHAKRVRFS
jgi:hypothetical protein